MRTNTSALGGVSGDGEPLEVGWPGSKSEPGNAAGRVDDDIQEDEENDCDRPCDD